jgi:Tfp pilus assembly protein PilO
MNRTMLALSVLGSVLLVVLFWLLLWSPKQEELELALAEIETVQAQQVETEGRIRALEGVRERAPELEAELAAGEAVLPRDTALPSALRQLQTAADEAGATLVSVSPGRPVAMEGADATLGQIPVNVELRAGYFQAIDFLRRLEDPTISPRGLTWTSLDLSVDEYPRLTVILAGQLYAELAAPPAPEAVVETPAGDTAEDGTVLESDGTDPESEGTEMEDAA